MSHMPDRPPKVSVVLPTYNHLGYLPAAVASALDQTSMDFELIVVNDGSTDGTRAWLDGLRHPNVRVVHQENRGFVGAVNAGIAQARGEYLSWMSADNRCARYFVEAFIAALDSDPSSSIAYSTFYTIDADDRITGIKFDNVLLLRELVTDRPRGMAGFMYRRAIHDVIGLYEGRAPDTLMWAKAMEVFSAVFVLEPTYYYRFHEDRGTVKDRPEIRQAVTQITASFLNNHDVARGTDVLARLYPGVERAPHLSAYARSDFACRLSKCGFKDEALALIGATLETAARDELLRPLINAVGLCGLCKVDPVPFVSAALDRNGSLGAESRDACIDIADAAAMYMTATGSADLLSLEASSLLLAVEKPRIFSYSAWKDARSLVPVRAI
jgi:hypothetical protein